MHENTIKDIERICKIQHIEFIENVPDDFVLFFKQHVNWQKASRYKNLSEEFIDEFADCVAWMSIIRRIEKNQKDNNKPLPPVSFFKKHWGRFNYYQANEVSRIIDFPDEYVFELIDLLNISNVIYHRRNQKPFSEDFIRSIIDKVDANRMYYFIQNRNLSEKFIREFADKLNWSAICENADQTFTDSFIDEFADKIHWSSETFCKKLSEETTRKYLEKIPLYVVFQNINISEQFRRELIDCSFRKGYSARQYNHQGIQPWHWRSVVSKVKLSEQFIEDFASCFEMSDLCRYQDLSESFMRKHKYILDWRAVSECQYFSEEFAREFYYRLDFKLLSENPKLELSCAFYDDFEQQFKKAG